MLCLENGLHVYVHIREIVKNPHDGVAKLSSEALRLASALVFRLIARLLELAYRARYPAIPVNERFFPRYSASASEISE